ncbi:MAG: hypothetical protein HYZ81_08105 [Nitrospinae bacterium]|nr:hypothetical protein [Nitrospinota bacterium]
MELKRYPLAANNFIFGVSNFFVLPLPSTWELVRGPFDPEVDRQARRGDVSWVQEGRAMYLLMHRGYRATVELQIDVRPRPTPLPLPSNTTGWTHDQIPIGGHLAEYVIGERLQGWWARKRVRMLRTAFYCDVLGRGIGIELLAEGGEEAHLREVHRALSQLQCH